MGIKKYSATWIFSIGTVLICASAQKYQASTTESFITEESIRLEDENTGLAVVSKTWEKTWSDNLRKQLSEGVKLNSEKSWHKFLLKFEREEVQIFLDNLNRSQKYRDSQNSRVRKIERNFFDEIMRNIRNEQWPDSLHGDCENMEKVLSMIWERLWSLYAKRKKEKRNQAEMIRDCERKESELYLVLLSEWITKQKRSNYGIKIVGQEEETPPPFITMVP